MSTAAHHIVGMYSLFKRSFEYDSYIHIKPKTIHFLKLFYIGILTHHRGHKFSDS